MTKSTKILFAFAVIAFSLSFAPFFRDVGHGILRPFGAAGFILSFINHILAKEFELFDAEQRAAPGPVPARPKAETDRVDFPAKSQNNNSMAA